MQSPREIVVLTSINILLYVFFSSSLFFFMPICVVDYNTLAASPTTRPRTEEPRERGRRCQDVEGRLTGCGGGGSRAALGRLCGLTRAQ